MKNYRKILAAVDFSGHAGVVALHAVNLARDLKAELIFINVINDREVDYIYQAEDRLNEGAGKINIQKCIDRLYEERQESMEELKKQVDPGKLKYRFVIRKGVPFRELLEAISDEGVDMLVMGIKGRSNLADVMVGSTALKMFKRCPVSLLTVRKEETE